MNREMTINVSKLSPLFVGRFQIKGARKVSNEMFERFCRQNPEMRIEQTANGEIIIMPGTGGLTGKRNFALIGRFGIWVEQNKTGVGFDSSTIFVLPNNAKRSPDVSWIKNERWNDLTREQQEKFAPICPDFVVELRSKTDSLTSLQNKMLEYIENGAQLGWLIDPAKRKVYVYRLNTEVEILDQPETVSGDPLLPGFVLKLKDFWE